jgi:hypothetical protein
MHDGKRPECSEYASRADKKISSFGRTGRATIADVAASIRCLLE